MFSTAVSFVGNIAATITADVLTFNQSFTGIICMHMADASFTSSTLTGSAKCVLGTPRYTQVNSTSWTYMNSFVATRGGTMTYARNGATNANHSWFIQA